MAGKRDPTSPTTSQASTVPGDDAEAKRLAAEGNKARLAEMEREAYQKRKALQNPGAGASTHDKAAEKVEKLRRVGSQEILQGQQPTSVNTTTMPTSATTATKPTSATTKPTTGPARKGPKKLKGKGACAKKGKGKCKKTKTKKKQHAGSKAATLTNPPEKVLPTEAPVREATPKVKEEPSTGKAVPTPARSQVAPPVTPVPAKNLDRSNTGDLVRDMLNRAGTQEQMTPTSTKLPDKPKETDQQTSQNQLATPATPSVQTKPARKARDPAVHRRKMKFFRSLESQGLVSTHRDFICVSLIDVPQFSRLES